MSTLHEGMCEHDCNKSIGSVGRPLQNIWGEREDGVSSPKVLLILGKRVNMGVDRTLALGSSDQSAQNNKESIEERFEVNSGLAADRERTTRHTKVRGTERDDGR